MYLNILIYLALFTLALVPIKLDDFFIYLVFGKRLWRDGGFGPVDTLIFTATDYQWQLWHEWLTYLYYYAMQSLGGYWGVIAARALMVTGAFGLVWRVGRRLPAASASLILAASVWVASPRVYRDRSSIFSDLFLLLLLYFLINPRLNKSNLRWALPAFFAFWVQWHSSFVFGWFFLGLFYVTSFMGWSNRERRQWFFIGLASAIAPIFNPEFMDGVLWPIRAMFNPDWGVLGQLTEFQPTLTAEFHTLAYKIFFGIFLLAALTLSAWAGPREGWFKLAVTLTVAYLGLRYSRMVSFTGMGLGLILMTLAPPFIRNIYLPYAIAVGGIVLAVFNFNPDPLDRAVPLKAANFLLGLPPGNVFNEWQMGGFLAWTLDGRQKIAAHGFVSDPKLVQEKIYRFSVTREGWEDIIVKNKVRYFFISAKTYYDNPQAAWIREFNGPGWRPVYSDAAAMIFQAAP